MTWLRLVAAFYGLGGIIGATLYAHARPVPALGQAAVLALVHAPVLLWLSDKKGRGTLHALIVSFFALGILLFMGSIYLKYLGGFERATAIAPAGGSLLILGWGLLLVRSLRPWT